MYGKYGYYYGDVDEMAIVGGVLIVVALIYLAIIGLAIANYVMTSLGLQKLASRRQVPNPWMAWLPFANNWLVGNIVDEYDGRNGLRRKWRVLLLTLSLISFVGVIVMYAVMFANMFKLMRLTEYANYYSTSYIGSIFGAIILIYVVLIVVLLVSVAQSFCKAICIYKIFESTVPEKSVKYLLLYLLVPLGGAVCLLKCKDKGYPQPEAIWESQGVE